MTRSKPASPLRHYFTHGLFPQLRVFEACARLGNFSRAAEELCLAQPTVSCQIRKLNETVGVPLFDMSGRKVVLTPAGRELQELCGEVFERFAHFDSRIAELCRPSPPVFRVAATHSSQYAVARVLGHLAERAEDRQIAVQIMNRRQILDALHEQQHDVYFVEDIPAQTGVDVTAIGGHELAIVAPRGHRLAARRLISLEELSAEFWILREEGSGTRDALMTHFSAVNFVPRVRITLDSNDAIRSAVIEGTGLGILPLEMSGSRLESEGLVRLNVEDFPLRQSCYAATPKGRAAIPQIAELVAALANGKDASLPTGGPRSV